MPLAKLTSLVAFEPRAGKEVILLIVKEEHHFI